MKKILFAALFACILFSCKQNKPETVERAFYYWKSNEWHINEIERKVLDSAQVTKLYVKFFEVGETVASV